MRASNVVTSVRRASTSKVPPQALEGGAGLFDSLAEIGGSEHRESLLLRVGVGLDPTLLKSRRKVK